MRCLLQRVKSASVQIRNEEFSSVNNGLLILCGIEQNDAEEDLQWMAAKICQLRIFADADGKMNLDLKQSGGQILLVSQFTLYASVKKGNRPSFIHAARPEKAIPLYEAFKVELEKLSGTQVKTGVFGEDMQVELINDGPVTIMIDSKNRE